MAYYGKGTSGQILTDQTAPDMSNWQNGAPSNSINQVKRQVFTSSGTYTPTTGMVYCDIEVLGAGGGGGGCSTSGISASGGGGGGYARKIFSSSTIGASQTVTIGTGGTAGANTGGTGGTGGTSSVGSLISATGGTGGHGDSVGLPVGAGIGGVGSSGDFNTNGEAGNIGALTASGKGGSSFFGGGAVSVLQNTGAQPGNNATSYGGGGSGASVNGSAAPEIGGTGFAGIVIVTEYIT